MVGNLKLDDGERTDLISILTEECEEPARIRGVLEDLSDPEARGRRCRGNETPPPPITHTCMKAWRMLDALNASELFGQRQLQT